MTDNHVHVGWYSDRYHSPREIWLSEQQAGIDEIVVSSTSSCAELYKLVVHEMRELIRLGGSYVHPILWITPRMMKTWGIRYMLHSGIKWQGVKMHWKAHREWFYNKKLLYKAMETVRRLQVPIILHTGEFKECKAGAFMEICKQYDDLSFVLAHGRPLDETTEVLSNCPNVFVDTAFMPSVHVKVLADAGFCHRILFGTDIPINLLYNKGMNISQYIKTQIDDLRNELSLVQYNTIIANHLF